MTELGPVSSYVLTPRERAGCEHKMRAAREEWVERRPFLTVLRTNFRETRLEEVRHSTGPTREAP